VRAPRIYAADGEHDQDGGDDENAAAIHEKGSD
jgi:hypothetical protein